MSFGDISRYGLELVLGHLGVAVVLKTLDLSAFVVIPGHAKKQVECAASRVRDFGQRLIRDDFVVSEPNCNVGLGHSRSLAALAGVIGGRILARSGTRPLNKH